VDKQVGSTGLQASDGWAKKEALTLVHMLTNEVQRCI